MVGGFGRLVQPADITNRRRSVGMPAWSGLCSQLLAGSVTALPAMADATMRASSNAGLR